MDSEHSCAHWRVKVPLWLRVCGLEGTSLPATDKPSDQTERNGSGHCEHSDWSDIDCTVELWTDDRLLFAPCLCRRAFADEDAKSEPQALTIWNDLLRWPIDISELRTGAFFRLVLTPHRLNGDVATCKNTINESDHSVIDTMDRPMDIAREQSTDNFKKDSMGTVKFNSVGTFASHSTDITDKHSPETVHPSDPQQQSFQLNHYEALLPLFDKHGILQSGRLNLRLWPVFKQDQDIEPAVQDHSSEPTLDETRSTTESADISAKHGSPHVSCPLFSSLEPGSGKVFEQWRVPTTPAQRWICEIESGEISPANDWLDSQSLSQWRIARLEEIKKSDAYLTIELPRFDVPVRFQEYIKPDSMPFPIAAPMSLPSRVDQNRLKKITVEAAGSHREPRMSTARAQSVIYPALSRSLLGDDTGAKNIYQNTEAEPPQFNNNQQQQQSGNDEQQQSDFSQQQHSGSYKQRTLSNLISADPMEPRRFVKIIDPDIDQENLVEAKHRWLARSYRTRTHDMDLKPDPIVRDKLQQILDRSSTYQFSSEEKDLLWRYRFYLRRYPGALCKFLKVVVWDDPIEANQVYALLKQWAEINIEDALELLGAAFPDQIVREFAIRRLSKADDSEVILYLLQLVQALKFETAVSEAIVKTYLKEEEHSGVCQEGVSKSSNEGTGDIPPREPAAATREAYLGPDSNARMSALARKFEKSALLNYLIDRSIANPIFANDLHWFLSVESADHSIGNLFVPISEYVNQKLRKSANGDSLTLMFTCQQRLTDTIQHLASSIKSSRESRPRKISWLQGMILDDSTQLREFQPVPIPLDSQVIVKGISAQTSSIFKSTQSPLLIDFIQLDNLHYTVIYKSGDDLRQDQLVVQIMRLMDKLLREQNLDLRITPYRILPLGPTNGMVQFVPSITLTEAILRGGGSLHQYLRLLSSESTGTAIDGAVDSQIMDNFVRSCAGYSVMTYLLGVGDRHAENIMMRPEGKPLSNNNFSVQIVAKMLGYQCRLDLVDLLSVSLTLRYIGFIFHIDFGYILGREPKPFSTPMKVSRELIEGLGGQNSPHFQQFESFCVTAFMILRKRVNLILSLFTLMQESSIADIRFQSDKSLAKLRARFCLEMSDDEAIEYLRQLILESSSSFFPQLMDRAHNIAQYFRS